MELVLYIVMRIRQLVDLCVYDGLVDVLSLELLHLFLVSAPLQWLM